MSSALVSVRSGEELNEPLLRRYLAKHAANFHADAPLTVRQFPGGHSNLTYLVSQGSTQFVLRRPPIGSKVKTAHDMGREFRVLSHLAPHYAKAPTPLLYCEDLAVLGSPFYLMQQVEGTILRKEFPGDIEHSPALCRSMCLSMMEALSEFHQLDYREMGLADLGRPDGYALRQVQGWTKRYQAAQTDDIPAVEALAKWLLENVPPQKQSALLHNDFKFDNLVLAPEDLTQVVGILDWEMATLGDPLMDLGTALSYWVQADDSEALHQFRFGPTHLPGMLTRTELAQHYAESTQSSLDHIVFYYAFGLFKSVGVVQQIYYRYDKGLTQDPRFQHFLQAVNILSEQAVAVIGRGTIG